jgi:hypothetical protein
MLQVITDKITYWDTRISSQVFGWNGTVYTSA